MEAVQKDRWYFVVLISLPFLKVAVQLEAVTVGLEEGMVLQCLCPWQGNLSMVSWTKEADKNPIAVFHPEYGVSFSHHYRERIEFLRTTPLDGSIAMTNVTHQDIGVYHCSVQTFPQGPWTRDVRVEDLDQPPEDHLSPQAPTPTPTPIPEEIRVDRELVVEQDHNVTILCEHKGHSGGAVNQVILERRPPGDQWWIIGVCKGLEAGLLGEDYSERGRVGCSDSLELSLQLTGVLPEDAGLYRCTFSTEAGMQTTTLLLTVLLPGGFSLSLYMMYIYIGSGAAGVILLIAVIIVAVRHRRKNKREEYRVKLHPSQKQRNIYENILVCPRKKGKQIRPCPVYANLPAERPHKTSRQLHV